MSDPTIPGTNGSESLPERFFERLRADRQAYPLPLRLRETAESFAHSVLALLFPHFCRSQDFGRDAPGDEYRLVEVLLEQMLRPLVEARCEAVAAAFLRELPSIHAALHEDARAIYEGDPAAESIDEVILAYPGFLAIAVYRIAHVLYEEGVPLLPRVLTEYAHRETGIDIHAGARIGAAFSIDHGTGVVVGETTVIGDRVRIFQGVTLGALCVSKEMARTKRHPTIGDDVVIYANATILGGETEVGARSLVGGNVWLTQSVPPDSVVTRTSEVRRRAPGRDELLEFYI